MMWGLACICSDEAFDKRCMVSRTYDVVHVTVRDRHAVDHTAHGAEQANE